MSGHGVAELFRPGGFTPVNQILCRTIGHDAALLVAYLSGKASQYVDQNSISQEGWFFHTQSHVEFNTGLSKYKQRTALTILKKVKFIETKVKGNPAKTFYKLNFDNLITFYSEYQTFINKIQYEALQITEVKNLIISFKIFNNLEVKFLKTLYLNYIERIKYYKLKKSDIDFNILIEKLSNQFDQEIIPSIQIKEKFPEEKISFVDSIKYFPKEYQKNKEFKKMWRRWLLYRQKTLKNPATLLIVKKHAKELPEFLGMQGSIDRLYAAIDSTKQWAGLVFDNDKNGSKQKSGNGNGGNGNGKQPEPIKIAKLIIDAFEMESPNIKRLNTAVQETEAYLDKWAEYWHKQRKGKEWHECPNWSMSDYIPSAEQLYIKYIESMTWVNGQPNEALFDFGNTQFIKFRKQYQKRISGVNWETGGSL
jgi:hypothetical protein